MNYKRYFYGGGLIIALLLSHVVKAQTLEIDFSEINGFGIAANKVRIDNILVRQITINELAPNGTLATSYLGLDFKACLFHDGNFYLTPIFEEEPLCQREVEGVDFSRTRALGRSLHEVQLNHIITQTPKHTILRFNPETLELVYSHEVFPPKQIVISLDWANNADLDIHLSAPIIPHSPERFHLYFGNKSTDISSLYIGDGLFEARPEVITITPPLVPAPEPEQLPIPAATLRAGVYRLMVHNFILENNFLDARAIVTVKIGEEPEQVFAPPLPPENVNALSAVETGIWEVFELQIADDGMVTLLPLQRYQHNRSPHEIRRRPD